MANKVYNLLFTFPKLKSGFAQPFVSIEAPNLGRAVAKGFSEIKSRKGIKGARISEGKISFTVEDLNAKGND